MTSDCFAVRVKNVSKIYHLWDSPRARLVYPLKRLLTSISKVVKPPRQSYRPFYALNNIFIDIRKGESWGFIGVNGSGKSTLLKIISGNLRPSEGYVEVDGKVVILDYGSGFNGEFTGKDNIYIKAVLLGLTRRQINERYDSIVEFAELGDFITQPVKTYSSGMVSRLGFAIIAHVDADIIITDEALAVGDVFFVQKCMRFIRNFLKKGTFLFVSHSTNDVISLCQNAVWLHDGIIKAIGPASKVTQAYLDKANGEIDLTLNESGNNESTIEENKHSETVLGQTIATEYNLKKEPKDARLNYLSHKIPDNDIQIPLISAAAESKDAGGANILNVSIVDEENKLFSQMMGGEEVTLNIEVMAIHKLNSPIVIFQVLDRLGQILFSDNSYLFASREPFVVNANTMFTMRFLFTMPLLPPGSYVIRAAVGIVLESTSFIILHTVNNALAIHSVSSGQRHGLVGIPMHSIKIKCKNIEKNENDKGNLSWE